MDEYYDWPANMTGPDRDHLVQEDVSVGLITTYCDGYDGFCPADINDWIHFPQPELWT